MKKQDAITARLLREGLVPLAKAASARGLGPHSQTLLRWAHRGLRGIRLESCLVGRQRMTSEAAFERFLLAAQQPREGEMATD